MRTVAIAILRELAGDRGKGPWFPALMNRLQSEHARQQINKGLPDDAPDPAGAAIYEVFRTVLMDETVPDFRHDAGLTGDTANPLLYPAVVAGQAIALRAMRSALISLRGGEERLRLSCAEAISQASVQRIPGDANGALKDRWIGVGIAVIEAAFDVDD